MARPANIAAIVLAAGQSSRMGEVNKLLAHVQGKAMVRHAVDAALESDAASVVIVTGHDADKVCDSLEELPVSIVHNEAYAQGMSTSLKRGLQALTGGVDGAVICLADMPGVNAGHLNSLIQAFDPDAGRSVCVPVYKGRRGNPVLWSQSFFPEMMELTGDKGARELLQEHQHVVHEVEMPSDDVLRDIDTPEAFGSQHVSGEG